MLFALLAQDAGLSPAQILGFSVFVVAGAAQLTAIQMLADGAPLVVAVLASLTVNLRMAMYSASMVVHFGTLPLRQRMLIAYWMVDQTVAVSSVKFEERPDLSLADKRAVYFGSAAVALSVWYSSNIAGLLLATHLPRDFDIRFALPLTFVALIGPMMRHAPHILAAFVATLCGILFYNVPYNLGLILAGLAGMSAGAALEVSLEKKKGQS